MSHLDNIKISIAIPSYKRADYIQQALQSCMDQNYEDLEIIVGDDFGLDVIRDICHSFSSSKIQYIRYSHPLSLVDKLNRLLNSATGDWMLYLGDDDYLEPLYVHSMLNHIKTNPGLTLVRSRYRLVDENDDLIRLESSLPSRMMPLEFLNQVFRPEYKMNIAGVMFPRGLFEGMGGVESLTTPWDSDRLAWIKLAAKGFCIIEPEPLCNIRQHSSAFSGRFHSDHDAFIQSNADVKKSIQNILNQLELSIESKHERSQLCQARQQLEDYSTQQIIRTFDQSMLGVVDDDQCDKRRRLEELIKRMKQLQAPQFISIKIYQILSCLPNALRQPLLNQYKKYKVKKLLS